MNIDDKSSRTLESINKLEKHKNGQKKEPTSIRGSMSREL